MSTTTSALQRLQLWSIEALFSKNWDIHSHPAVARCLSEGEREVWVTQRWSPFSKTSCIFEVGTTRVCFSRLTKYCVFYLRISFTLKYHGRYYGLWLFLLTEEAKDLGVGSSARHSGVRVRTPPLTCSHTAVTFTPKPHAGFCVVSTTYVVRTLVADCYFLVTYVALKPPKLEIVNI